MLQNFRAIFFHSFGTLCPRHTDKIFTRIFAAILDIFSKHPKPSKFFSLINICYRPSTLKFLVETAQRFVEILNVQYVSITCRENFHDGRHFTETYLKRKLKHFSHSLSPATFKRHTSMFILYPSMSKPISLA